MIIPIVQHAIMYYGLPVITRYVRKECIIFLLHRRKDMSEPSRPNNSEDPFLCILSSQISSGLCPEKKHFVTSQFLLCRIRE